MTKRHWYRAHQNHNPAPKIDNVKIISKYFGYTGKVPYKHIELYDLRYQDTCTTNELFSRYF